MIMNNVKISPDKFPLSPVLIHLQYSNSIIIFSYKFITMNLHICLFPISVLLDDPTVCKFKYQAST